MDQNEALEIGRKYIQALREKEYLIEKAYLFGSHAKGSSREYSDIDIAVVLDEIDDSFDLQVEFMKLRRQINTRIEPHPFLMSDFNNSHPLAYEILKNGVEIQ